MRTLMAAAILSTTLTAAAFAQEDSTDYYAQTNGNKPQLSIGAGVNVAPEYSGADTYDTNFVPLVLARKEITPGNTLFLKGFNAGLDHTINDKLTVGAQFGYRGDRDSSDSSRLAGMEDIDAAIEFGPKVRYQVTPAFGVDATTMFDVSGASDGYTARAGADFAMPLSEVTVLTVNGGLNYGSKNFNNTYYGVRGFEAAPGRPAYQPGSGFTKVDAGVGIKHAFTNHWSLNGKLGADYLLGDVADSPLVDQEFQPVATVGAAYTF